MRTPPAWLIQSAACATAVLASLGVLLLYTRPDFLLMVADQVWACF
jgi:hypothetical protein